MGKRQECSAADSGCLTYNESPLWVIVKSDKGRGKADFRY